MYYRVAIQVDAAPTWQWKSTVLSELSTLFQFLRLLRALRKISCGSSPAPHGRDWRSSSRRRTKDWRPIR